MRREGKTSLCNHLKIYITQLVKRGRYSQMQQIMQQSAVKSSRANLLKHDKIIGYSFIFPAFLIIMLVMIFPLCYGLFISLFDYKMGQQGFVKFLFLGNYINFFKDSVALNSVKVTVLFTLGALLSELFLGILISVLLLRLAHRLGAVMRGIYTMPLLVSPIIIGLIWRYMFDPSFGLVYEFLNVIGLGNYFGGLGSTNWALFCIIVADAWENTPFVILVITSGLICIPNELYESGRIDGAGGFRLFRYITLPMLTKVITVVLLIRGGDAFRIFDIIYALTEGGPANSTLSLSINAFKQGFQNCDMGYGMAISIVTMVLMLLIFGPLLKFTTSQDKSC